MADNARPPFRADHVGSLLRPKEVLQARDEFARGEIGAEQLAQVEDAAIREIIRMQGEVGLKSATDGELRRQSWHMDFIYQLGGIEKVQRRHDPGGVPQQGQELRVRAAVGPRDRADLAAQHDLRRRVHVRAGQRLGGPDAEADHPVAVAWCTTGAAGRPSRRTSTPTWPSSGTTSPPPTARRSARLYDLGCRYLQLDDTSLAYVNDPAQREHVKDIGGDPLHQHETYIATINKALANRPADLTVTTHMCRGNNQSMWAAEGGYDFVADTLFNKLDVDGFFCEWDDERSGGFEPLRYLPKGKRVVLGVVTSKRGELESKDFIKRRIEEAAKYTDIDQLCLSAQCGFSSTSEGNDLTEQQQWDKLRLIVEVAQEIWGE